MEVEEMTREQLVDELTALRESEKRFRLMAENSLDYIFHESIEGRAIYCSPAIERILGYTSEERRGKHFSDVIAPHCLAEARASFEKAVRGEAVDKFEVDLIRKDGRTITVEVTLSPVVEKGEITSIFGIIRDISERKQAQEDLIKAKTRLEYLLTVGPGVIYCCEPFGDYAGTFISENVRNQLGYEPDEFTRNPHFWADNIHPEDRPSVFADLQQLFEQDYHLHEYRFRHMDGTYRWLCDELKLVRDEDNNPREIIGCWYDITKRKEVDLALQESEQRYRKTLDDMLEGCQIISSDWEYLYVNDAVAGHGRRRKEELLGRTMMEMYPGIENTDMFIALRRCMEERIPHRMENEFAFPDGSKGWYELSMQPVPEGVFILSLDITERKQAEKELKETEERLRAFMDSAPEVFGLLDSNMNLVAVNKTGLELYGHGVKREDLLGKNVSELYPAAFQTGRFDKYVKILESGEPVFINDVVPPPPYENARWAIRAFMAGENLGIIISDTTEYIRVEEELRKSEQQYRFLAENVTDVMWIMDMELNYTYVSPSITKQRGYTVEEFLAKNLEDTSTQEFVEIAKKILKEEQELEKLENIPKDRFRLLIAEFACKDGSTIWIEGKFSFLRDDKGKAVGLLGVSRDITARKQAEEALRESEKKYRALIENTNDIAYSIDAQGNLAFISPQVRRYGIEPEDALFEGFWEFIHPEDREKLAGDLKRTMATGEEFPSEFRLLDKDGQVHWLEEEGRILQDESGKITGISGMLRDITKRKETEEALRESEEKWRSLVENAPNIILVCDRDGIIQFINHTVPGLTVDETIGTNQYDYIEPDYHDMVEDTVEKVFETGKPGKFQIQGVGPEGAVSWYDTNVSPVKNRGQVVAVTLMVTDITERKEAEKALRESESKYRILIENLPLKIFTKDREAVYVSCNDNFALDLGVAQDEFAGKTDYDFFPSELAEKYRADDKRVMETEVTEDIEEKYVKDGKETWVHTVKTPVRDDKGEVMGILGIFWDITERKNFARRLATAQEEERRRLSMQLHDDLGQLLTVARIRVDRLRDARFSDIVTITRELSDVSGLLEDVLEKTRDLSRRLRPPLLDQLGLGAALRNLAAQFGSDTGMKVVLSAEEDCPQLPEEVQMLIYRVAREGLTNVARHAGAKEVIISLDIDEEYAELSIADDGKGFVVGEVEKRSDCLGIRSLRSRVNNAGGIFQLVSEISRGTTLQVKVPVKPQED